MPNGGARKKAKGNLGNMGKKLNRLNKARN